MNNAEEENGRGVRDSGIYNWAFHPQ